MKVSRPCECCEEIFTREVNKSNAWKVKYCSRKCMYDLRRTQKYGLTFMGLKQMIADQNGCCSICKRLFDSMDAHNVNIDHDHETGKIRAILCLNCNQGLGQFKDSIENLEEAIRYLRKYN